MEKSNGNGWVLRVLTGFLFTATFTTMMFLGNNIIANDKVRQNEDKDIRRDIRDVVAIQQENNEKTAVTLATILTELKNINKKM